MKNEASQSALEKLESLDPKQVSVATDALFSLLCSTRSLENSDEILNARELRDTRFAMLCRQLAESGERRKAKRLARWLFRANEVAPAAAFIRLYNSDAHYASEIMQAFLREENDVLPYPDVIIISLLAYQMNLLAEVNRAILKDEFSTWEPLIEQFVKNQHMPEIIRGLRMPLRYYGGGTHTVLRLYDYYFKQLLPFCNMNAEFCGDLGGGYATSEISRLSGRSFTSLDILCPDIRKGDPQNIILRRSANPWSMVLLRQEERENYIEVQSKVPWIEWNVLDPQPFPKLIGDYQSYLFTSCGFLSSSVRPFQTMTELSNAKSNDTSRNGCQRIIELACEGKDVSFLAIERATLSIRNNKALVLRWKDRRLVEFQTLKNPKHRVSEKSYLAPSMAGAPS